MTVTQEHMTSPKSRTLLGEMGHKMRKLFDEPGTLCDAGTEQKRACKLATKLQSLSITHGASGDQLALDHGASPPWRITVQP